MWGVAARSARAAAQVARPAVSGAPRRALGGGHGGHGGAHKPAGPYDLPHHAAYPETAYPFGLSPTRKTEGWEAFTWVTYAACFAALAFGLSAKGNSDSFTEWARREALARETVKENGGEVVFGTYYANASYEEAGDCGDTMAKVAEK